MLKHALSAPGHVFRERAGTRPLPGQVASKVHAARRQSCGFSHMPCRSCSPQPGSELSTPTWVSSPGYLSVLP